MYNRAAVALNLEREIKAKIIKTIPNIILHNKDPSDLFGLRFFIFYLFYIGIVILIFKFFLMDN